MFKKKVKQVEVLETITIQEPEQLKEIMELADKVEIEKQRYHRSSRFKFWSYIAQKYPQVKKGEWVLSYPSIFIVELKKIG